MTQHTSSHTDTHRTEDCQKEPSQFDWYKPVCDVKSGLVCSRSLSSGNIHKRPKVIPERLGRPLVVGCGNGGNSFHKDGWCVRHYNVSINKCLFVVFLFVPITLVYVRFIILIS